MNSEQPGSAPSRPISAFRNWLSLTGGLIVLCSACAFIMLVVVDSFARSSNPYIGILTYLVTPMFTMSGAGIAIAGALWRRRQMARTGQVTNLALKIDFSRPRDRKMLAIVVLVTTGFLLFTAVASYHSYHFTESVEFCGEACHTVMEPEYVTYQHSPHARVACTECHIGPGAEWYVRSKISGTYQVYAVMADKYPKPIPTPIKNLRPAQETCEQCHWPQKFVGNTDRTYDYFLTDDTNSAYSARMLLKVGGGDPTYGPIGGIHWHMNVANKVEYIATDPARQKIPWVRMTDQQGTVTEFRTPSFTNDISQYTIRTMDCMDCHNRPAHHFESPNAAVNQAMGLGELDPTIPLIKSNAVTVLLGEYKTKDEALTTIATKLSTAYPNEPRVKKAIEVVQQIYSINFFPEMKADWRAYPDNMGHKDWPGCFRCHDGNHKSNDGQKSIEASDCNACHLILAQGSGDELNKLSAEGMKFKHPGEEIDDGYLCSDCHNGGL